MACFFDTTRTLAVYESPKTGGTTLRIWLFFLLTGNLVEHVRDRTYYHGTTRMLDHLLANGYSLSTFAPPPPQSEVWQLVRCPLDRFASLVRDKVIREGWRVDPQQNKMVQDRTARAQLSFDAACEVALQFLTETCRRFTGSVEHNYMYYHTCPQVNHLGWTRETGFAADRVTAVETANIDKLKHRLEALYGVELPDVHARNSRFSEVPAATQAMHLPAHVREAVCDFYADDFAMLKQVTHEPRSL